MDSIGRLLDTGGIGSGRRWGFLALRAFLRGSCLRGRFLSGLLPGTGPTCVSCLRWHGGVRYEHRSREGGPEHEESDDGGPSPSLEIFTIDNVSGWLCIDYVRIGACHNMRESTYI